MQVVRASGDAGFGAEERSEEGDLVSGDRLVRVDEDALEEDLVEEPPDVLGSGSVRAAAVLDDVECVVEDRLDLVVVLLGSFEAAEDLGHLVCQACLFALEQVDGDGAVVVGFEEFAALAVEATSLRPNRRSATSTSCSTPPKNDVPSPKRRPKLCLASSGQPSPTTRVSSCSSVAWI
ncbi:hypothetical protein C5C71_05270 [Rathayibacter sp. AY1C1]|uniref:hypothetical protein n=1 Tax=Rathayibacter sp. AY1C1 TaxID=2080534 RepID=UPI000CE883AD|nr:hypothetical protein [Rathayibacter sp. AY1C1]PPH12009.1 hypothetical protein C5C71_05270 [Rathayibacter sp. AY1C1]